MAEKEKATQNPTTAPDPEEDDLDDLDDVLDSFQSTKISQPAQAAAPTTAAPTSSGPGRPAISHDAPSEEDFASQLQAGMHNLISELDANPEMQAEFEKMMQELIAAGAAGTDQAAGQHLKKAAETAKNVGTTEESSSASSKKPSAGRKTNEADFQASIRKTMERMQASDSTAKQSTGASSSTNEDDLLAAMMRELTESGEGGEEGFNAMLMNMMAHLTNKEILYDPMKELHEKYPAYLEKNASKLGKEVLERYRLQQGLVREIVERFERKGYSDENEDDREYIVERMQKMQAAGSPPSDLVGDMNAAQEALGDLEGGCPTQ